MRDHLFSVDEKHCIEEVKEGMEFYRRMIFEFERKEYNDYVFESLWFFKYEEDVVGFKLRWI